MTDTGLTNEMLRKALEYWLPQSMPLEGGSRNDPIVARHQDRWREAKALLSSEYPNNEGEKQ